MKGTSSLKVQLKRVLTILLTLTMVLGLFPPSYWMGVKQVYADGSALPGVNRWKEYTVVGLQPARLVPENKVFFGMKYWNGGKESTAYYNSFQKDRVTNAASISSITQNEDGTMTVTAVYNKGPVTDNPPDDTRAFNANSFYSIWVGPDFEMVGQPTFNFEPYGQLNGTVPKVILEDRQNTSVEGSEDKIGEFYKIQWYNRFGKEFQHWLYDWKVRFNYDLYNSRETELANIQWSSDLDGNNVENANNVSKDNPGSFRWYLGQNSKGYWTQAGHQGDGIYPWRVKTTITYKIRPRAQTADQSRTYNNATLALYKSYDNSEAWSQFQAATVHPDYWRQVQNTLSIVEINNTDVKLPAHSFATLGTPSSTAAKADQYTRDGLLMNAHAEGSLEYQWYTPASTFDWLKARGGLYDTTRISMWNGVSGNIENKKLVTYQGRKILVTYSEPQLVSSYYNANGTANQFSKIVQRINVTYTDVTNADSDGDGLKDWQEVETFGTDPLGNNTDGDLIRQSPINGNKIGDPKKDYAGSNITDFSGEKSASYFNYDLQNTNAMELYGDPALTAVKGADSSQVKSSHKNVYSGTDPLQGTPVFKKVKGTFGEQITGKVQPYRLISYVIYDRKTDANGNIQYDSSGYPIETYRYLGDTVSDKDGNYTLTIGYYINRRSTLNAYDNLLDLTIDANGQVDANYIEMPSENWYLSKPGDWVDLEVRSWGMDVRGTDKNRLIFDQVEKNGAETIKYEAEKVPDIGTTEDKLNYQKVFVQNVNAVTDAEIESIKTALEDAMKDWASQPKEISYDKTTRKFRATWEDTPNPIGTVDPAHVPYKEFNLADLIMQDAVPTEITVPLGTTPTKEKLVSNISGTNNTTDPHFLTNDFKDVIYTPDLSLFDANVEKTYEVPVVVAFKDKTNDTLYTRNIVSKVTVQSKATIYQDQIQKADPTRVGDVNILTEQEKTGITAAWKAKQTPGSDLANAEYSLSPDGNLKVAFDDGSSFTVNRKEVISQRATAQTGVSVVRGKAAPAADTLIANLDAVKTHSALKDTNTQVTVAYQTTPDTSTDKSSIPVTLVVTDAYGTQEVKAILLIEGTLAEKNLNNLADPKNITFVKDPTALSDTEAAAIEDEVKKANEAQKAVIKSVTVDKSTGVVTVTYNDDSTNTLTADKVLAQKANPSAITVEKDHVLTVEDVQNAITNWAKADNTNGFKAFTPATENAVDLGTDTGFTDTPTGNTPHNWTVTVTDAKGNRQSVTIPVTVKPEQAVQYGTDLRTGVKTYVANTESLSDSEKSAVLQAIADANDGSKEGVPQSAKNAWENLKEDSSNATGKAISIAADGTATFTFKDGSTMTIAGNKLVAQKGLGATKDLIRGTDYKTLSAADYVLNKNSTARDSSNVVYGQLPAGTTFAWAANTGKDTAAADIGETVSIDVEATYVNGTVTEKHTFPVTFTIVKNDADIFEDNTEEDFTLNQKMVVKNVSDPDDEELASLQTRLENALGIGKDNPKYHAQSVSVAEDQVVITFDDNSTTEIATADFLVQKAVGGTVPVVREQPLTAAQAREAIANNPSKAADESTTVSVDNVTYGLLPEVSDGRMTTYAWANTSQPTTAGDHKGFVKVTTTENGNVIYEEVIPVTLHVDQTDAEKNSPQGTSISVNQNTALTEAHAKQAIVNNAALENVRSYSWKEGATPDTATAGADKAGTVIVTYNDGTTDEVPVKVNVLSQADRTDPKGGKITVDYGTPLNKPEDPTQPTTDDNARKAITAPEEFPEGTIFYWKDHVDTTKTDEDQDATVVVRYPDGSEDEVPVKVRVRTMADQYNPLAGEILVETGNLFQKAPNENKYAEGIADKGIANAASLPDGTIYEFVADAEHGNPLPIDPGPDGNLIDQVQKVAVKVTYPDGSSEIVNDVLLTVGYETEPQGGKIVIDYDHMLTDADARAAIKNADLMDPKNVFAFKNGEASITKDGDGNYVTGTFTTVPVNVQLFDKTTGKLGEIKEATATVVVIPAEPIGKNISIDPMENAGDMPDPKTAIANADQLKFGEETPTIEWDTTDGTRDLTKPGDYTVNVKVSYDSEDVPDYTVPVNIHVSSIAEKHDVPVGQTVTVAKGYDLRAEANKKEVAQKAIVGSDNTEIFPAGTKFVLKASGETALADLTKTVGTKPVLVDVIYPDDSRHENVQANIYVPMTSDTNPATGTTIYVNPSDTPLSDADSAASGVLLKDETKRGDYTYSWKAPVDISTPGDKTGTVIVHYDADDANDVAEVPVKVHVYSLAETNEPTGKNMTIPYGGTWPVAADLITNKDALKNVIAAENPYVFGGDLLNNQDTTEPGTRTGTVTVTYSDGSKDTITQSITVLSADGSFEPQAQTISIDKGTKLTDDMAVQGIKNFNADADQEGYLPKNTTFAFDLAEDAAERTPSSDRLVPVKVTYPDGSTETVDVPVHIRTDAETYINNTPDKKLNDGSVTLYKDEGYTAEKAEEAVTATNTVPFPEGTEFVWTKKSSQLEPGTSLSRDESTVTVTFRDGSSIEVPTVVTVGKRSEADPAVVKPEGITRNYGYIFTDADAQDGIQNYDAIKDVIASVKWEDGKLPSGTTDGSYPAVVTFKDGTTQKITIPVTINDNRPHNDKYDPSSVPMRIKKGTAVDPDTYDAIAGVKDADKAPLLNVIDHVRFQSAVDTDTVGVVDPKPVLVITYKDGTEDTVAVDVSIYDDPAAGDPIDVSLGKDLTPGSTNAKEKAKEAIGNSSDMPEGTTYDFEEAVDTSKAGETDAVVIVTKPGEDPVRVPVKVNVVDNRSDKDKYDPDPKDISVAQGTELGPKNTDKAKEAISNAGSMPEKTTFAFKNVVDTSKQGTVQATVVVTYPDQTSEKVTVNVHITAPSADPKLNNEPKGGAISVEYGSAFDKNNETLAKSGITNTAELPDQAHYVFEKAVDTTVPGVKTVKVLVTYPNNTVHLADVTVTVGAKPVPKAEAGSVTVEKGTEIPAGESSLAKDAIRNSADLPDGTKYEFKNPVDTTELGVKDAVVIVTKPGQKPEEVTVKVEVKMPPLADADQNVPKGTLINVNKGDRVGDDRAAEGIANKNELKNVKSYAFEKPVDTSKPGDQAVNVVVTYQDGSKDVVKVTVHVSEQKDRYEPKAGSIEVEKGSTPGSAEAAKLITNQDALPEGTTYAFTETPDTVVPGEKPATVRVTYPDGSYEDVTGTIRVKGDADKYDPKPGRIEVAKGTPLGDDDAKKAVENNTQLPDGTKYTFKDPVDTSAPGEKTATVIVTYPDGTKDEITVPVTVKQSDADRYDPKSGSVEVEQGKTPTDDDAKKAVENSAQLPDGTKYTFKDPVDTRTPGDKPATVIVTYPDGSREEIGVNVHVPSDADKYDPKSGSTEVEQGKTLTGSDAKKAVENSDRLPDGTKYTFKDPVNTKTPGVKTATVIVTYPDGSKEAVTVQVTVKKAKGTSRSSFKPTPTSSGGVRRGGSTTQISGDTDQTVESPEVQPGTAPSAQNEQNVTEPAPTKAAPTKAAPSKNAGIKEKGEPEEYGWALFTLIFAILAAAAFLMTLLVKAEETERGRKIVRRYATISKIIAAIGAVIAILTVLFFEKLYLPMTLVDRYTIVTLLAMALNIVLNFIGRRKEDQ